MHLSLLAPLTLITPALAVLQHECILVRENTTSTITVKNIDNVTAKVLLYEPLPDFTLPNDPERHSKLDIPLWPDENFFNTGENLNGECHVGLQARGLCDKVGTFGLCTEEFEEHGLCDKVGSIMYHDLESGRCVYDEEYNVEIGMNDSTTWVLRANGEHKRYCVVAYADSKTPVVEFIEAHEHGTLPTTEYEGMKFLRFEIVFCCLAALIFSSSQLIPRSEFSASAQMMTYTVLVRDIIKLGVLHFRNNSTAQMGVLTKQFLLSSAGFPEFLSRIAILVYTMGAHAQPMSNSDWDTVMVFVYADYFTSRLYQWTAQFEEYHDAPLDAFYGSRACHYVFVTLMTFLYFKFYRDIAASKGKYPATPRPSSSLINIPVAKVVPCVLLISQVVSIVVFCHSVWPTKDIMVPTVVFWLPEEVVKRVMSLDLYFSWPGKLMCLLAKGQLYPMAFVICLIHLCFWSEEVKLQEDDFFDGDYKEKLV